jgi:hypothetical protein
MFEDCSGLETVNLEEGLRAIEGYAFSRCSSLTTITIPRSVTSIKFYAFQGVDFSTITSYIKNPFAIYGKTSGMGSFSVNTFEKSTLFVLAGTLEKYQSTEGWKDFANIEEVPDPYDLNGDEKVSTADIQVIINEMKKSETEQSPDYDLNNDGKVSTADIQIIINEMKL